MPLVPALFCPLPVDNISHQDEIIRTRHQDLAIIKALSRSGPSASAEKHGRKMQYQFQYHLAFSSWDKGNEKRKYYTVACNYDKSQPPCGYLIYSGGEAMEVISTVIPTITLIRTLLGILMGTVARFVTIRVDSRQVPSYPNGYFINLVTGFFAASLGSVAIPALLSNDFAAVTFLMLAVQHFRDIRKQIQESLENIDPVGFAPRGSAYIDGISKTFEARNYICLLTSLGTVLALYLIMSESIWINAATALVTGSALIWCMIHFTKGKCIGDICTLHYGNIDVRDSELYVDGIWVTCMLGLKKRQQLFMEQGVALVATPKSENQRLTLENDGQRAAILHDAARSFGTKELWFTKRSFPDGRIVIAFVPIINDKEKIITAVRNTPILESVRKRSPGR